MAAPAAVLAVVLVTSLSGVAYAQTASSRTQAATLLRLLDAAKLDSFATKVGGTTDEYLSVLYIPNVQLLVVRGRYADPPALDARIAAKDYRGAYADHNSSTLRDGKLFVMDLQADGLALKPQQNQPFDIAYENGVKTTLFNGDWKAQKFSEKEYQRRFEDIERRYAEMLAALCDALEARH